MRPLGEEITPHTRSKKSPHQQEQPDPPEDHAAKAAGKITNDTLEISVGQTSDFSFRC